MFAITAAVHRTVNVAWRNGLQGDGATGGESEAARAVLFRRTAMIT
jgi:hypothetical protein